MWQSGWDQKSFNELSSVAASLLGSPRLLVQCFPLMTLGYWGHQLLLLGTRSDSFSLFALLCLQEVNVYVLLFLHTQLCCSASAWSQTDLERPAVRVQRDFPAGYANQCQHSHFSLFRLRIKCLAEKLVTPPISISLFYFLSFIVLCTSTDLFNPDFIDEKNQDSKSCMRISKVLNDHHHQSI